MQYGNKSVETSTQVGSEGLNRTMQYGNLDRFKVEAMADARFKSYYVVWKLERGMG